MKITVGQIREILGLTQDAFRHWKVALPPLTGRNGYRPCFTFGDVLALAIVKELCDGSGVRVGALKPIAGTLFVTCNKSPWTTFERSVFIIQLARSRVVIVSEAQAPRLDDTALIVPCRPIIAKLREGLLAEQPPEVQGLLMFPPTSVAGKPRSRAAANKRS